MLRVWSQNLSVQTLKVWVLNEKKASLGVHSHVHARKNAAVEFKKQDGKQSLITSLHWLSKNYKIWQIKLTTDHIIWKNVQYFLTSVVVEVQVLWEIQLERTLFSYKFIRWLKQGNLLDFPGSKTNWHLYENWLVLSYQKSTDLKVCLSNKCWKIKRETNYHCCFGHLYNKKFRNRDFKQLLLFMTPHLLNFNLKEHFSAISKVIT